MSKSKPNAWERELSNVVQGQQVKREQVAKQVGKPQAPPSKPKKPFPWRAIGLGVALTVGAVGLVAGIAAVGVGAANLQAVKIKKGDLIDIPKITLPPVNVFDNKPEPEVPLPPPAPKKKPPQKQPMLQQGGNSRV